MRVSSIISCTPRTNGYNKNNQTDSYNRQIKANTYNDLYHRFISFKSLGVSNYKDFNSGEAHNLRLNIFGDEKFANPIPIKGIDSQKFHCNINIYGIGDLHLMLMPIEDDLHNLVVTSSKYGEGTTNKNLNKLVDVCNELYPNKKLYVFESGSSLDQLHHDKNGIIQTHIHYLLSDDIPNEKLSDTFEKMSERKLTKVENITLDDFYKLMKKESDNGNLGYKYISKQRENSKNFDIYYFIENNPKVPRKSQLSQHVFSTLVYNNEGEELYNWKKISKNPEEWSEVVRNRIMQNRKNNTDFLNRLKKFEHKNLLKNFRNISLILLSGITLILVLLKDSLGITKNSKNKIVQK